MSRQAPPQALETKLFIGPIKIVVKSEKLGKSFNDIFAIFAVSPIFPGNRNFFYSKTFIISPQV